jgi:putative membrane protein
MLPPVLAKNDKQANWLILVFSFVVFAAVVLLSRIKLEVNLGFDIHFFAKLNAFINSIVSLLLLAGLMVVRQGKYLLHKRIMIAALVLSVIFLVSYICHHLLAGETKFGDINHDGLLSETEKALAGSKRMLYFIILATHIPLAGLILPFILYTAYRALIGEWPKHVKLAKITWPVWLYVSVTGVLVYLLISPYYQ